MSVESASISAAIAIIIVLWTGQNTRQIKALDTRIKALETQLAAKP